MKTQINTLLSGVKNQMLNPNRDYSSATPATSHNGHSGSSRAVVNEVWEKVISENQEVLTINFLGEKIELKKWSSTSGKSVYYQSALSSDFAQNKIGFKLPKKGTPSITISSANMIEVRNGKNIFEYICPSLIEII